MTVSAQHQLPHKTLNVLLHVLPARVGKILGVPRTAVFATSLLHQIRGQTHWRWSVIPHALDAAWVHLLEPNDKHTVRCSVLHQRPGKMQTCGARRARIVGVVNWDGSHAKLVEDALA
jgi:hypothetical protein